MASSKQSAAEKKTKATKLTKSSKKQNGIVTTKRNPEKNNKTANGTVSHSNGFVSIPSSSVESQEDGEQGRSRSAGTSKRARVTKPTKGKRKQREEEVNDVVGQREEEEEEVGEKQDVKTHRFPMHRIKTIIRSENSDLRVTQEALFVVNKATEKFLEQFTKDAYSCCVGDRKKSLAYKHLSSVICTTRRYDFLSDFVPEKIKAENALAERKLNETEVG
ncbi:hypothetical protein F2P56_032737 [Juglans regia]|uniref:Transcription factor CBF/NF-Y/archaeal histone domain-containing protein n=2 Tax=Juglans regia TaxID=51240 RepID=A0A833THR0_JUGRE|nr:DNA polymerase epsilon subunit C-like [Juglans regia]KAF5447167.1 hypothetical protein F2P56_032737 [Juglans regia]